MSSHLAHVVFDCPHLARRSQRFLNATWLVASSKCLTLSSSRISFSSLRPTLVYNSTQTRQNNTIRLESDALSHDIIQNKYSKLQVKLVTSMACGAGLSLRRMVGWFGSMFGFASLFGSFRFEGSLVDSMDGYRWVD